MKLVERKPATHRDHLPENEDRGGDRAERERTNTEPLDTAMPEVSCLLISCGMSQSVSGLGQRD